MGTQPPELTKAGFLRLIDDAAHMLSDGPPHLCSSTPWSDRPLEIPGELIPIVRLAIQLDGRYCNAISIRGQHAHIELQPGDSLYWVPNAWTIPFFDTYGSVFGLAFWRNGVRLTYSTLTGKAPTEWTPYAYHTALPLSGAGTHVLRALNCLAEEGNQGPASRELVVSLLHLVRQHVADDAPATHSHGRAAQTWQAVQVYLEEHFGRQVDRASVAQALGLHPNYLSALARQVGGVSFSEVLDGVRISQARRLLLDTDVKLARIAALCGYRNGTQFGKVFRRLSGMTPGRFRGRTRKPA